MAKVNIPLSRPDVTTGDKKAVSKVLDSLMLSCGPEIIKFESLVSKYIGMKYTSAVSSGTAALHLIMLTMGIKTGDEVITSPFSFISSANSILFTGARPVFCDIDSETLNINPALIEKKITSKTKAILAVDVFGLCCDYSKIRKIARKHNLKIIEDSCEALGAEYRGKKAGSFGDVSCFAFYPNKQITTGEGGVVLTNKLKVDNTIKALRNQGRLSGKKNNWLQHNVLGYNFRISDINCALGISQLNRINLILEKRRKVADEYFKYLSEVNEIKLLTEPKHHKRSWFVFVIRLQDKYTKKDREKLINYLEKKGIAAGRYFVPIHLQPHYKEIGYKKGDFPVTEKAGSRVIALPFFTNMSKQDVKKVCNILKTGLLKI